jgi:MFS family permease
MNLVVLGIFGACLLCSAAAIWSLYTSNEERNERRGFLYSYAAFFAYILLATIFAVILFITPPKMLEETFVKFAVAPALGPVGAFAAGKFAVSNTGAKVANNVITPLKFRKNSLLG